MATERKKQQDRERMQRKRSEQSETIEKLTDALAAMLDAWSGYPTPECDAAIAAMQSLGIDRWSAQSSIEKEKRKELLKQRAQGNW